MAALGGVLLLLEGFTLPLPNAAVPKDVLDFVAGLSLGTVADEFGGTACYGSDGLY